MTVRFPLTWPSQPLYLLPYSSTPSKAANFPLLWMLQILMLLVPWIRFTRDHGTQLHSSTKKITEAEPKYATSTDSSLHYISVSYSFTTMYKADFFKTFMDHKTLVGAMANAINHLPHQISYLSFVAEFINDVQHVSG